MNQSDDGKRWTERLTTRDYCWLIIVLVLVIIWILTQRYGSEAQLVSYMSFASTLSALILAVIAILYTLVEAGRSSRQIERMTQAVQRLESFVQGTEDAARNLQDAVRAVRDTKDRLAKIEEKLDRQARTIAKIQSTLANGSPVTLKQNASTGLVEAFSASGTRLGDLDDVHGDLRYLVPGTVQPESSTRDQED